MRKLFVLWVVLMGFAASADSAARDEAVMAVLDEYMDGLKF